MGKTTRWFLGGDGAMNAQCPECESLIRVPSSAEIWDNLVCPRCHTELRLISDSPLALDYADYGGALDDDDDDDYDYFDNFEDDVFELTDELDE
jgi:hypothetical protein